MHAEKTIYIVEDNGPLNTLIARQIERTLKLRVVQATRAEFIYPALGREPAPLLLLSDFQLAGRQDGADLAAWMRSQPHLAQTRRVLLTGTSQEHVRTAVRRCGYVHIADLWHAVIEKPASASTILSEVVAQVTLWRAEQAQSDDLAA